MATEYLHVDIISEELVPFGSQSVRAMRLERHTIKHTGISRTSTRVRQLPTPHNERAGTHLVIGIPFKNAAMHNALLNERVDPCVR